MTMKRTNGTTDQRAMGLGVLMVMAMLWLPGCAGRTGSPIAQLEPPTPPVLLADAAGASAQVSDATEKSSDDLFDPFAKSGEDGIEEYDPWEPLNTKVFEFNRQVDRWILKPVAQGYNFVMPNPVQIGISNFFYNLRFPPRFFNNIFQGKAKGAGIEMGRFLVNTTAGVGGLFDVAQHLDLKTPEEDTGQTLGFYGVGPGPYLMIPLLPPFTVRDLFGFLGDIALNPINWLVAPIIEVKGVPSVIAHKNRMTSSVVQLGSRVFEIVNDRSLNLEKYQGVEEATLDLYAAVRNAYLQQRAKAIRE
ncbi:putative VacJ-like lipoprotein [Nitrospira lenta]|uniref:Putative VacJ-like lipoprotein n=2 Tax=Nitrospira lenta TaxID=1436998 RepID=A0A330L669_9BACT|nr:putative VacJ-like lipoprotein [Nitrospira lenta]